MAWMRGPMGIWTIAKLPMKCLSKFFDEPKKKIKNASKKMYARQNRKRDKRRFVFKN